MSFIQQYLQSRAEASSPAYAAKMRGQRQDAALLAKEQRDEQRLKQAAQQMSAMSDQLYGRQAQPAQYSDAFSQEEIQGMPPEMLAEMETQAAVQGQGLLGQDMSPERRTDIEQRRDLMGSDNAQMQQAALKMMMARQQDNRDVRQRREDGGNKQFADQWLNLGDKYINPATGVSHDISRQPQGKILDLGDSFRDTRTGEIIPKNLVKKEVNTSVGKTIGDRLKGFNHVMATGDSVVSSLKDTSKMLEGLSGDSDWTSTGWASLISDVPTFPAMNWNEKKEVISSRLAVDKMAELKALSPSGSTGFGALSERELDLLQKQLGSLKQAQSGTAIKRQIAQIQKLLNKSIRGFEKARGQEISWYNRNRTRDLEEWKEAEPQKPKRKVIKWADYKKLHGLK